MRSLRLFVELVRGKQEAAAFYGDVFGDVFLASSERLAQNSVKESFIRLEKGLVLLEPRILSPKVDGEIVLEIECAIHARLKHLCKLLSFEGKLIFLLDECPEERAIGEVIDRFGIRWMLCLPRRAHVVLARRV
jgi:uncharacterized glyoxalase superfamily protein PhnB